MLKLYNSLTRQKEVFKPIEEKKVKLYACGMTVYDVCHIGHARTHMGFDVIVRYLRWLGYEVVFVRNITDIDDKIINRAAEQNISTDMLVEKYIAKMDEDFGRLGILKPDLEPRATESISGMIEMIQTLIDKGYAYVAGDGDVFYSVDKFKGYGKLSGQNLEQLNAGERVAVQEDKEHAFDFALWKSAKPGEPTWDAPWGAGRPGWHIECSVMSKACLGETFDIHGGGSDLKFPHHENEIAQSEAANGRCYAKYWMHTGMVQVNAEKMSKSLGNFFTIEEVLDQYQPEVIRYFLISGQYRSEINYSEENLNSAKAALTRFYTCLRGLPDESPLEVESHTEKFKLAMDDDFNTPEALAVLFDLAREVNRLKESGDEILAAQTATTLKALAGILGLLQDDPEHFLQGRLTVAPEEIKALIEKRNVARAEKNWALSDEIRDSLFKKGIILDDGPQGTTWRHK